MCCGARTRAWCCLLSNGSAGLQSRPCAARGTPRTRSGTPRATKNVHKTYQSRTKAGPVACQGRTANVPKTYQKRTKNVHKTYRSRTKAAPVACQGRTANVQYYGVSKNMGVAAKTLGFLKIRAQGLQILTGPYFFFLKLWSGGVHPGNFGRKFGKNKCKCHETERSTITM